MNTNISKPRFLASDVAKLGRGGGGQDALFKAFPDVINDFVRVAVRLDFVLRPR